MCLNECRTVMDTPNCPFGGERVAILNECCLAITTADCRHRADVLSWNRTLATANLTLEMKKVMPKNDCTGKHQLEYRPLDTQTAVNNVVTFYVFYLHRRSNASMSPLPLVHHSSYRCQVRFNECYLNGRHRGRTPFFDRDSVYLTHKWNFRFVLYGAC